MSLRHRHPESAAPDGYLSWSPAYDLRNCGIDVVRAAIANLEERAWEPWFAAVARAMALDNPTLDPAVRAFAAGLAAYLRDPARPLEDRLDEAGFAAPGLEPQRVALLARIGQRFLRVFNHAISVGVTVGPEAVGRPEAYPYRDALQRLEAAAASGPAEAAPADLLGRLGLGLQLLRPYAAADGLGWDERGHRVDVDGAVPAPLVDRLAALGWRAEPAGPRTAFFLLDA